jgi:hypothetical protein
VDGSAQAIQSLMYTYAERQDAGDLEGLADLFAHGRIAAQPDGSTPQTFAGRDAVLGMYQAAARLHDDGTPRMKHVVTNAIIELDAAGGVASARSSYTAFQQTDVLPLQPVICGRYHDSFQRLDGVWWFDTRIMLVDLIGDLSQHLRYELS